MKFCQKCGKEIMDEAVVCPGCGCAAAENQECLKIKDAVDLNNKPKVRKVWIFLGAVVLLLGIISAVLFVPRDLKMDDFKETTVLSAIIHYGLPESIDSGEGGTFLRYGSKVDFYGITPYSFIVYPEANAVVFFFSDDVENEVYSKISRRCDLEENLLTSFQKFSYGNLYITTYYYDGSYVRIEID